MENNNIKNITSSKQEKLEVCKDLKDALDGKIGDIVSKHEELIVKYYEDVQVRGKQSFDSAKMVARFGFFVLIITLTYTILMDYLVRKGIISNLPASFTVGQIGIISGVLIEFIAGVNFWLYGKSMRQFNAFHICLERTHRYLIAFKIAEKITKNRDETLENLVCIMANASMITSPDVENYKEKSINLNKTKSQFPSSP